MSRNRLAAFSVVLMLVGCKVDEPQPAPAAPVAPQATEQAPAESSETPAAVTKQDPASLTDLEAGLAKIMPRIVAKQEAYQPIEPKGGRLFMHPSDSSSALVEIDVAGLSSLTLSPYILDFSGDKGCEQNPGGGIVEVVWSVDGAERGRQLVDRNYTGLIPLQLDGASKLKVDVNNGNNAPWCDWAAVGFVSVTP